MSNPRTNDEIRDAFIDFFVERGHHRLESAPLVPVDDPTLLFTNAGMVPFKPYFLGRATPPARRLTTVQRCFRTTDIEETGDLTHHTFFEMLGNFSVGDYFKEEVIPWSWEFCTRVLGLPADRLWVTVFTDDDEAFEIWRRLGRPAERILRYGEEEGNFWTSGEIGPCGPCSELHYDYGEEFGCGPDCEPKHACGRFLEIWNLVFMSYMQHADGTRTPLPQKNIDTGAGLERVAAAVQGVRATYETSGLRALLDDTARLARTSYGEDPRVDRALRVLVDHGRAVSFLIADGVLPSNEGRGYVLRRVIRRAVYFGRTLELEPGFMERIAGQVIERFRTAYPYLDEQARLIRTTLAREERVFRETLERGLTLLDQVIAALPPGATALPGTEAYRLYDTYGLPKEVTAEIAAARGLTLDEAGFEQALESARERSRRAAGARFEMHPEELAAAFARLDGHGTVFDGYEHTALDTHIAGIIRGGTLVERVEEGQEALLILAATPFYPEGGGQVGDAGQINADTGRFAVKDTQRDASGVIYHVGQVTAGYLSLHDQVRAAVDVARRQDAARNHTGTHLLHASLRTVLGSHVHQRGSLVAPDRLRFDYNHTEAPNPDQLAAVRELVNEHVRADSAVRTRETSLDEARAQGVLAIFGEKYGERVRVVEIDGDHSGRPFSAELCGGTHVHETGEIGGLFVVSESSIGSGLRRIEALTGATAERWIAEQVRTLERASRRLGVNPADLEAKIIALQDELAAERRRIEALQREASRRQAGSLAAQAETVGDTKVLAAQVAADGIDGLRRMADELRQTLGRSVVVLGTVAEGRPGLVIATRDLDGRIDATALARRAREATGIGGGGNAAMAVGGGRDAARLPEALELVRQMVKEQLSGRG